MTRRKRASRPQADVSPEWKPPGWESPKQVGEEGMREYEKVREARQSARLKEVTRGYTRKLERMGISIPDGWVPEVYTEEHEKLLGNCEKPWTLYVDGYKKDGERLYDPLNGKMCHQCRLKTVGNFSICGKCKSAQGQLCGDCLYMRYGENVLEVNENINWSCPSCRDICNCSRCRRAKGWAPTACVYQKVVEQGYKSIAHYLIQSANVSEWTVHSDAVAADSDNTSRLEVLSLNHNSDAFAADSDSTSRLEVLSLNHNSLSGQVPSELKDTTLNPVIARKTSKTLLSTSREKERCLSYVFRCFCRRKVGMAFVSGFFTVNRGVRECILIIISNLFFLVRIWRKLLHTFDN